MKERARERERGGDYENWNSQGCVASRKRSSGGNEMRRNAEHVAADI